MYRGFNLELNLQNYYHDNFYYNEGQKVFKNDKTKVKSELDNFMTPNGALDGSKMQMQWFPQVKSDVFISHSHKDEDLAIFLAGFLDYNFGIKAFIDSCIWGYSNDLLKSIDKQFCQRTDGSYDYDARNFSTSHVHMMLLTALNKMIDNTECLFFLNTPNSISAHDSISKTKSPWIYAEIAIVKTIRKKEPNEHSQRFFSEAFEGDIRITDSVNIEYDTELSHLNIINNETLNWWHKDFQSNNHKVNPLDILYNISPIQ